MRIAAFDIGIRNFAFIVADTDHDKVTTILEWHNMALTDAKTRPMYTVLFDRINRIMDEYAHVLETCDVCLVEKQMAHLNVLATRISHHVLSYFSIVFPNVRAIEFPAYHKTENATCRLMTKLERKIYCIQKTIEDLVVAQDDMNLGLFLTQKKQDDMADVYQMVQAYTRRATS